MKVVVEVKHIGRGIEKKDVSPVYDCQGSRIVLKAFCHVDLHNIPLRAKPIHSLMHC